MDSSEGAGHTKSKWPGHSRQRPQCVCVCVCVCVCGGVGHEAAGGSRVGGGERGVVVVP